MVQIYVVPSCREQIFMHANYGMLIWQAPIWQIAARKWRILS